MKSRSEEIFYEDLSIRQRAIGERRGLSRFERRHLAALAKEARELQEALDAERLAAPAVNGGSHGPVPRDPSTLPASMRPGARGND